MHGKMRIPAAELLGVGIYVPAEAAAYAGVQTGQITRWVHGNARGDPVVPAQFRERREIITFVDLVQAMAVRDMRRQGISLQRIRDAADWMRRHYPEIRYPFAVEHRTYVNTVSKQIVIVRRGDDPTSIVQVSGDRKGQLVEKRLLDQYLRKLKFDGAGLASRYIAMDEGDRRIVLDPQIRLGQPRVEPCGYLVDTLVAAASAEGGAEVAAWWYKVDKADVDLALKFHKSLGGKAA